MSEAEVYAGLTEIFRELFGDEAIALTPATCAADIPEWDSFNNINIIAAAEERFGVKLGTRDIEALENVGDLVRLIHAKRAA
jgi:acyl carrier protein